MTGNRRYDLADRVIYLMFRLFEGLGYGRYDLTTYRYRDKNWHFKFGFINIADNIRWSCQTWLKSSSLSNSYGITIGRYI